jgi:hypothetical protein
VASHDDRSVDDKHIHRQLPPVYQSPLEVQKKQNSDKATVSKEQEEKSDGGGAQDNE